MNSNSGKNKSGTSSEYQQNLDILRQIDFFSGLPLEATKVFAYLCSRESCKSGDVIFNQGDEDDRAFYIVSGQARRILLEVAADNPRILDDPEPMATFEQFGDSSLNLVLRGYLPDMEHRLATITELHAEIHRRFAAEGIQIPFPQRDVHLRDGKLDTRDPGTSGGSPLHPDD